MEARALDAERNTRNTDTSPLPPIDLNQSTACCALSIGAVVSKTLVSQNWRQNGVQIPFQHTQ
jgi:hypothetical protein